MARGASDRAGVLIVRAWLEGGDRLRLRVTYRTNVLTISQTVAAAATADDVCAHVHAWLDRFLDRPPAPPA